MFENWKMYKDNMNEEEYSQVAEWCNDGQKYHIEDFGDYYAVVENPQPTEEDIKQRRIEELKGLLAETDYKIIKCYEASMLNREMPYDLEALVSERDAWRQEINDLENQ